MDKLLLQYKTQSKQQEQETSGAVKPVQAESVGSPITSSSAQQVLQQAAAQVRHALRRFTHANHPTEHCSSFSLRSVC
jgi:hypothetical protein